MAVKFCEKCGKQMELTEKEAKWVKVCKECYAKEKQAEELANRATSGEPSKQYPAREDPEVKAERIARSTALTNAVQLVAGKEITNFILKRMFELADMNALYILSGKKPDIVLEEKIELAK